MTQKGSGLKDSSIQNLVPNQVLIPQDSRMSPSLLVLGEYVALSCYVPLVTPPDAINFQRIADMPWDVASNQLHCKLDIRFGSKHPNFKVDSLGYQCHEYALGI